MWCILHTHCISVYLNLPYIDLKWQLLQSLKYWIQMLKLRLSILKLFLQSKYFRKSDELKFPLNKTFFVLRMSKMVKSIQQTHPENYK